MTLTYNEYIEFRLSCVTNEVGKFRLEEEEAEGGGGAPGWIVSFADLMTLLFALFVVLYGLKEEGETFTVIGAVSSIRESFVEVPDDIPVEEKLGPIKAGKFVFPHFKGDSTHEPLLKKFKRHSNVLNVIDDTVNQLDSLLSSLDPPKSPGVNPASASQDVKVTFDKDGVNINFVSSFLFGKGDYKVKRALIPKLKELGTILKEIAKPLRISGHTGISTDPGVSKLKLSSKRALSIAEFFIKNSTIPEKMVYTSAYGAAKPKFKGEQLSDKFNRRVEITILYEDL